MFLYKNCIYYIWQRAIKRAADESGAFKDVSEEDLAQYVGDTAKLFADQVLAEAQMRNEPIDTVLKASDIVYEDGAIKLNIRDEADASGDEQLEQAMYKSKLDNLESFVEDVFNNSEDTSARYFANVSKSGVVFDIPRDTILHDKKHSLTANEWVEVVENIDNIENVTISPKKRFDGQAVLLKIATPSGKYGVVFEHMKNGRNIITTAFKDTDAKLDGWIKENSARAMQKAPTTQKGLLSGRSMFDIVSALDENVNNELYQLPQGAYDTQGKADINTPEFKAWFGDSKVVDENGRPLVVYHGTNTEFDTFDRGKASSAYGSKYGFYFANKEVAEGYGDVMPVYLAMKNPYKVVVDNEINELLFDYDGDAAEAEADGYRISHWRGETRDDFEATDSATSYLDDNYDDIFTRAEENGADGVIVQGTDGSVDYVVFEPSQIKSVYNRGTFDPNNDNIYYQRAFSGSRVDYDRPSLEAIGTGEGNQAHGWGLYYALDKDVAERYREDFERDNYFFDEDKLEVERQKQEKSGNFSKTELLEDLLIHHDESNLGNFSDEVVDWYKKEIRPNVLNKNYRKTQVHEVEIPENPYLLDEQKYIGEQSDIVKKGVRNTLMRLKGLAEGGAYPDYKKALTALDYEYADIENRIDNPDFYENKTGYQIYDIIEQIMGSNREASLFLLENGIKGITYEGQQDGRDFVIFNPDDVEVIQKFYQEQSVEQFFSPTNRDKRTYINDLRAAERGEAGNDYNIRLGALPVIYQKIGIENKPVKTKKTIILKDTISKHDVPMNVVENLPELYSNPLVIFKSLSTSTNPDSYVAVLDATDKNGRQMIAALSPSKKENGYHLITSFYGRNNIDNMIRKAFEEGKVKYIRDKKISLLAGHNAYLSQADNNILQKSDIVNSFNQNTPNPKGLFDANRNLIKIFESADFSTLPHELAHYWLNNMWNYVRSGNASERYRYKGRVKALSAFRPASFFKHPSDWAVFFMP